MNAALRSLINNVAPPSAVASARGRISDVWRWLFARALWYEPMSARDKEIIRTGTITFSGDAPVQIKDGVHEQGRMAFRRKRPDYEDVDNLVVTPKGAGWANGRLVERFSACAPGLRMLLARHDPVQAYPSGYWIQSAHKDTYGDWVSEYLGAVTRQRPPLHAPLFLPAKIASRPYVQRDLAALGLEHVSVERPVRIESARVLRQQKHFVHFDRRDVDALRSVFMPAPDEPRPGGVVYLSRAGEVSEVAQRAYPNGVVEAIVRARGGRVVRTADASFEDYRRAAVDAETVIFDHGSAFYNALSWRPRQVIEIVSDCWWNNAFLMFADAMGVKDYVIVRGDLGAAHVADLVNRTLDQRAST